MGGEFNARARPQVRLNPAFVPCLSDAVVALESAAPPLGGMEMAIETPKEKARDAKKAEDAAKKVAEEDAKRKKQQRAKEKATPTKQPLSLQ